MSNIVLWSLFGAVAAGFTLWQIRQNQRMGHYWSKLLNAEAAGELKRFALSRTLQMIFVIACCVAVLFVYNERLSNAGRTVAYLQHRLAQADWQLKHRPAAKPHPQFHPAQPWRRPMNPQFRKPPQQKPAARASNGYYPPLVGRPGPAAPRRLPAPRPAASRAATLNDIYNPEQRKTSAGAVIDNIKQRYENLLVTHMFLKKCGKAGHNDYNVIMSSLMRDMTSAHAPAQLQHDIIIAAQGSYQGMYSRSSCTDASVNGLAAQYANYIKALAGNLKSH